MPTALVTPARAKPRHEQIPSARLNPQSDGVAVRTTIALRQNEEEHDRGCDQTKNEEADKDDGKDNRVRHRLSPPLEPLLHLKPRLNVRQIAFDSLDHYLGAFIY